MSPIKTSLGILTITAALQVNGAAVTGYGPKITDPIMIVTSPKSGQSVRNASLVVTGTVKDNMPVEGVYYQLNSGGWTLATSSNSWSNWTASVTLTQPWTNTIRACAVALSGSVSHTNTVKFTYAVYVPVTVMNDGCGTVTHNYNGKLLQIGKSYSMTATACNGFGFTGWTGSEATKNHTLTFTMASNLTFVANFVDTQRPVLAILSPKANQKLSTVECLLSGRASDNVGVVGVYYQLNGTGWSPASTTNGYTNWAAGVTLASRLEHYSSLCDRRRRQLLADQHCEMYLHRQQLSHNGASVIRKIQ